ncbi:protein adenylyltransferase SelO [Jannaschia ovalis]|uniref:Protein nucleotidyltransferase YdiU n=1 Tax=Jannaschia ovalis TaxID=3038773 RepID=A0ABY8LAV9_9RHOB|nr:YdiU family protein [Jannaschia sp. GRR-S6-38]WGH78475.1 YdiU family protein [Jannaschia sp. GRR-S6-38]
MFAFDNSYARLPARFYTKMAPTPVAAPGWIALNEGLAREMGLDPEALRVAPEVFAGNRVPEGAVPLAQLYAGHQFGGWSPQLGDGRAILLGEHVADGRRWDVALKGSGPTPYSRMGDGRAAIGPVIREYLVSEAMHALGVPTTRALAAVTTGETVLRQEGPLPGAVLTRVAASHIRVGTFQVFAARDDTEALGSLLDHAIARHAPGADGPMGLLRAVMEKQARLVAQWMGLGFVHGVMNTDNMTISGETIDYGPCAYMEAYHPDTVFSSIDQFGRYAWSKQPDIALWNLAQLATALLPLMGAREAAVAEATEVLEGFRDLYTAAWEDVMSAKIGLRDMELAMELLAILAEGQGDFTNSFRALSVDPGAARDQVLNRGRFDDWFARWRARGPDFDAMAQANPALIPRNHQVEAAIAAAETGDLAPFHALGAQLADPWHETEANAPYRVPATPAERVTRTFCGT